MSGDGWPTGPAPSQCYTTVLRARTFAAATETCARASGGTVRPIERQREPISLSDGEPRTRVRHQPWPWQHPRTTRSRRTQRTYSPMTRESRYRRPYEPCVDGSELARRIFTSRCWSVQPCVRPVGAVHMTAGHNALRGSGPGQNPAFDNALAHVGCPDRRIDRLCITCCSPSQPSHHTGCPARSRFTPQARRVAYNARP
jgi:hypothetical protein